MSLPAGYRLAIGSGLDRARLLKFMQQTYEEMQPGQDYSHLALTIDHYFSSDTPLWWVEPIGPDSTPLVTLSRPSRPNPIAGLWVGNAIDQIRGDRHAHVFLLYVQPEHRRRGIGTALMHQAEAWARERGDRQMGLQVFQSNQPALSLYQSLGFQTQSLWMVKPLRDEEGKG